MLRKTKTILHVTKYFSPHLGGVETHVHQVVAETLAALVASNKRKIKTEIIILTLNFPTSAPPIEMFDGYKVIRLPLQNDCSKKEMWRLIWQQRQLFIKADLIHVHDVFWWLLPIWPLTWQKIVTTFHGWEGQWPIPWKNKLQRWLYALMSRATVHVGSYIGKYYWDKPNLVIYGGISRKLKETSQNKVGNIKLSNPKTSDLRIAFLGRLVKENNLAGYIKLLAELQKRNIDFSVTWIGDGGYKKQCCKYGTVTGMVNDIDKFLDQADWVMTNSYLSMMQAQLQGKIVLSLADTEIKQAYLDCYPGRAFLLYSKKYLDMANQIIELRNNQQKMINLANAGRRFARQQTWQKVAQAYLEIYRSCGVKI